MPWPRGRLEQPPRVDPVAVPLAPRWRCASLTLCPALCSLSLCHAFYTHPHIFQECQISILFILLFDGHEKTST